MKTVTVEQRMIRLLSSEGCGVLPQSEIGRDSKLFDLGFDSLRYMELIVLLEEELGIEVPDGMLEIDSNTTVSELVRVVSRREP
ncbi:hypothetical protein YDYSG_42950 [Paenibacillus tyrfis]|uniref:Phosphopantetheine attachment protein n=3 Tax=Paenibacillus TaxID=44249 RepID=A0A081P3X3_9BACL|nr:phosphopantetheine attachment protein [Paenibacillus tyrfis]KPV57446.1 phosphopantetheine attachment protein [Paenibacillus sp. A3]KZE79115.1 phosphopantetheine attachment protein [Paenibacillus elgii]GLI08265.1 hypothetical protein YDYSG_42950 [Paenibacillus tyrfis]GMX63853.1 hypothetical protein Elgi_03780 [Paenibacillus elgii]